MGGGCGTGVEAGELPGVRDADRMPGGYQEVADFCHLDPGEYISSYNAQYSPSNNPIPFLKLFNFLAASILHVHLTPPINTPTFIVIILAHINRHRLVHQFLHLLRTGLRWGHLDKNSVHGAAVLLEEGATVELESRVFEVCARLEDVGAEEGREIVAPPFLMPLLFLEGFGHLALVVAVGVF